MTENGNLQGRKVDHSVRKNNCHNTIAGRKTNYRGCTTWKLEKYWVVKPILSPFNKITRGSIPYYFQCNDPRPQSKVKCNKQQD